MWTAFLEVLRPRLFDGADPETWKDILAIKTASPMAYLIASPVAMHVSAVAGSKKAMNLK